MYTFPYIYGDICKHSALGSEKISRWCYSCTYNTTVHDYTESTLNPDYNALYFEGIDDNITEFHLDSTFVQNVTHTHTHAHPT